MVDHSSLRSVGSVFHARGRHCGDREIPVADSSTGPLRDEVTRRRNVGLTSFVKSVGTIIFVSLMFSYAPHGFGMCLQSTLKLIYLAFIHDKRKGMYDTGAHVYNFYAAASATCIHSCVVTFLVL